VITRAASNAEPLGLEPAFAQKLYGIIVDEACKLEDKLIASQ
jgi:hypothetical protein